MFLFFAGAACHYICQSAAAAVAVYLTVLATTEQRVFPQVFWAHAALRSSKPLRACAARLEQG